MGQAGVCCRGVTASELSALSAEQRVQRGRKDTHGPAWSRSGSREQLKPAAEKAEGAVWTEGGTKNHSERQNEVMAAGAG